MKKKLYKIIYQEIESYTAFVFSESAEKAKSITLSTSINSRSNQDFEQIILDVTSIEKDEYPIGIIINK